MIEPVQKQILPTSAEEARNIGSVIYYSSDPCPNGHIGARYTSCYKCVECNKSKKSKDANKVWYKENGHIRNTRKREDRKVNPIKYAKQQKNWRDSNINKSMLIAARSRAKLRGLEFSLILSDIVIPDVCPILGIKLKVGAQGGSRNSPSLDRIDNTKGYVKGNVAVISQRANAIKRDASLEELQRIVKYMRLHKQV